MTTAAPTTTEPEQAADLAALQAAAAGTEAEAGLATTDTGEPPRMDLATEIAGLASVAVATLGPLFPSIKTIYTPEVTQAAAQAIAAVCNKHGWMQNGMMGEWGEEIACLAIVGPLALQTVKGVKADLAAREKDKPADPERITAPVTGAPVPTQDLGQKTVTFGSA